MLTIIRIFNILCHQKCSDEGCYTDKTHHDGGMLKNMKNKSDESKVVIAARKAAVSAKKHVEMVKEKASEFTRKAEITWEETKPHRKEAKEELKKAVQQGVDVGKEIKENLESQ